jgi:3-oxoacyl-[acyl-carrier-protein] synthase-3
VRSESANGLKDVYIAGVGAYSPGAPVPFDQLEDVLGRITDAPPKLLRWIDRLRPIMKDMLGVKYCHYAMDPVTREPTEDLVSMAIKASMPALEQAGLKPSDIDLLVYAGVIAENVCPPTSVLIQEKLQIPYCAEYEIHSNCTSIYKAIELAFDQIRLGRYKTALVTTAQLSSPFLRAEYFNQKVLEKSNILLRWFLSDGSGALVLTSDRKIGHPRFRVVETYNESVGLGLGPDMYCIFGGQRVNLPLAYEKGWHHLHQNFDRVAELAVDLGKKAADRMMERLGMDWHDVKYFFMNVPTRHIHDHVVSDLRQAKNIPNLQFYSKLGERGYPGPSAIIQGLEGFLAECNPAPGDQVMSVVAESSKWMYAGFVLECLG